MSASTFLHLYARLGKDLFRIMLEACSAENLDFGNLAEDTDGCSAADIEAIVEEAKMQPLLRETKQALKAHYV